MSIVDCSLTCSNSSGAPGPQVGCLTTNVRVNGEIRITFTNPIDPTTVTNNSFQLVEVGTGKTPAGTFLINPNDDRTLIYRPQLTFDSAGIPIFGLTLDKTYFFKVPGTSLDPLGPFIRSKSGVANSTRLQCTLIASEPLLDANPGPPRATITVDRVTSYDSDGNPLTFAFNVAAPGATDVFRDSSVRITFDDVMNPATLANPVTGQSTFIKAFVDPDGDTTDPLDQVPLAGSFTLTIDQNAGRTIAIFDPSIGLPSAGADLQEQRKIVIELSPQITDLGGNSLINPGRISFTPERILFERQELVEPFDGTAQEDPLRSGSTWGNGVLATGPGGGSGRLGDLVVLPGLTITLDTDFEDFSEITNVQILNPADFIDVPPGFAITDGVFEFSRLRVDSGGVLRFVGSNPARIYVRGIADIQGLIDVSGAGGVLHASNELLGGLGGESGPNGGDGGRGGNLPDGSAFTGDFAGFPIGGIPNPGAGPSDPEDPSTYFEVNGQPGAGIAAPSTIDPSPTFVGGGDGGLGWPQPTGLNLNLHMPVDVNDTGGLEPDSNQLCEHPTPAPPGGGGAHAFPGGSGVYTYFQAPPGSPVTFPPTTLGGSNSALNLNALSRSLSPELGYLRGGAGGGGGGSSLQKTQVNGRALDNCNIPAGVDPLQVVSYIAHSAAGGGGGGGGVQIAAGRRLLLNGRVDASGGVGGSGSFPPDPRLPFPDLAQAGAGGAGGSVLLQAPLVQIQSVAGRINVSGGAGGIGSGRTVFPITPALGGFGSPGLVRIEAIPAPTVTVEQPKILPLESTLKSLYGNSTTIQSIFTTATWTPVTDAPSGWSGAESCWIRLEGNFFRLLFEPDGATPGWDMRLRIAGQAQPQSFRGDNDIYPPGTTLEQVYGVDFGTSPVIVRFQGARLIGDLIDACSVSQTGPSSPFAGASFTGWVDHPEKLNDFNPSAGLAPNVFRFLVLWDASQPDFAGIQGLEDLTVALQPD